MNTTTYQTENNLAAQCRALHAKVNEALQEKELKYERSAATGWKWALLEEVGVIMVDDIVCDYHQSKK